MLDQDLSGPERELRAGGLELAEIVLVHSASMAPAWSGDDAVTTLYPESRRG
jgi:hypothetical protein